MASVLGDAYDIASDAFTTVKGWVKNLFGGKKKNGDPYTDAEIATDKLAMEVTRTLPVLVANNWQMQQFLAINKQPYYNSPLLNAVASFRYYSKNQSTAKSVNIIDQNTQYAIAALVNWLSNVYGNDLLMTADLDNLAKAQDAANQLKKDPAKAPEGKETSPGSGKYDPLNPNGVVAAKGKFLWIGLAVLAAAIVAVVVYFNSGKKTAAAAA